MSVTLHEQSGHPPAGPMTAYVLIHGRTVSEARMDIWRKQSLSSGGVVGGNVSTAVLGRRRGRAETGGNGSAYDATNGVDEHMIRVIRYDPSASPFRKREGGAVLVVSWHFIRPTGPMLCGAPSSNENPTALPAEVVNAVTEALDGGVRICTDEWLQYRLDRACRGDVAANASLDYSNVTEYFRMLFRPWTKPKKGLGRAGPENVAVFSAGCGGAGGPVEVVELPDSGTDDEGDAESSKRKAPPLAVPDNAKAKRRVSNPFLDGEDMDKERAERIRNRCVREMPSFRATWLRNLKGKKEAKVKAPHQAKARVGRKHGAGVSKGIPEAEVLAKATKTLRQRKGGWKYEFERCFIRQQEAEAMSPDQARNNNEEQEKKSSVPPHILDRNRRIAERMLRLTRAELMREEVQKILTGVEVDSEVSGGRKALKFRDNQRQHRAKQSELVAKQVQSFDRAVTLDCIEESKGIGRAWAGRSGARNSGKISCGGSTFVRLRQSILDADGSPTLLREKSYRLDSALLRNRDVAAVENLRGVWGIGVRTAARLVSWGVFNVHQLRRDDEAMSALNAQQLVGLERYEDFLERIPREEVAAMEETVAAVAKELSGGQVVVTACGSYRRGKTSCGDADLIMLPNPEWTDPSASARNRLSAPQGAPDDAAVKVMGAVLDRLREDEFLTDDLTLPGQFGENDGDNPGTDSLSYMGVSRLPGKNAKHRRIDIKAYPGCQGAFALLYFTGDAHFNRSMRSFANKAGLTLSDGGLACCDRREGKKTHVGESVTCAKEEDIFSALGVGYVLPKYRDCRAKDKVNSGSQGRQYSSDAEWSDSEVSDWEV